MLSLYLGSDLHYKAGQLYSVLICFTICVLEDFHSFIGQTQGLRKIVLPFVSRC